MNVIIKIKLPKIQAHFTIVKIIKSQNLKYSRKKVKKCDDCCLQQGCNKNACMQTVRVTDKMCGL